MPVTTNRRRACPDRGPARPNQHGQCPARHRQVAVGRPVGRHGRHGGSDRRPARRAGQIRALVREPGEIADDAEKRCFGTSATSAPSRSARRSSTSPPPIARSRRPIWCRRAPRSAASAKSTSPANRRVAVTARSAYGLVARKQLQEGRSSLQFDSAGRGDQGLRKMTQQAWTSMPPGCGPVSSMSPRNFPDRASSRVSSPRSSRRSAHRRKNAAGFAFLRDFVEEAKRSGIVASLIERHGVTGRLSVAPPAISADHCEDRSDDVSDPTRLLERRALRFARNDTG